CTSCSRRTTCSSGRSRRTSCRTPGGRASPYSCTARCAAGCYRGACGATRGSSATTCARRTRSSSLAAISNISTPWPRSTGWRARRALAASFLFGHEPAGTPQGPDRGGRLRRARVRAACRRRHRARRSGPHRGTGAGDRGANDGRRAVRERRWTHQRRPLAGEPGRIHGAEDGRLGDGDGKDFAGTAWRDGHVDTRRRIMIGRWTTTLASLALAATVGLTGCAAIRHSQALDREQFLAAAGFRMELADTAERQQQLAAMPPYRLTSRATGDGIEYAYA